MFIKGMLLLIRRNKITDILCYKKKKKSTDFEHIRNKN